MYTKLVEKLIFPLAQSYLRNGFYDSYRSLMASQWLPAAELETLQWTRFKAILSHAYNNVPLYRKKYTAAGVTPQDIRSKSDLCKLPVITKDDMRQGYPDEVTAENIPNENWINNSTSGSTGTPFAFIMDRNLTSSKIAMHFRNLGWAGVAPGTKHVKLWGAHDEESGKRLFTRYVMRRLELSCFDLDARKAEYYSGIRRYKPRAIEAYTSALVKLCKLMIADGITDIKVPSAIASAETLVENDRKLIESTLGCKVFNRYGSREFGNVAQECEQHNGLHINCENFLVEVVKDVKAAAPGELGNLIITCFDNHAMPFIRYDTGDMGVVSAQQCHCGRGLPLLASVDGRVTEFLRTPSGKLIPYLLFNYLFEQFGPYVEKFRVIQETIDAITVKIVPTGSYTADIETKLLQSLRENLGSDISMAIEKAADIPLTAAGKQICVESRIKH